MEKGFCCVSAGHTKQEEKMKKDDFGKAHYSTVTRKVE